MKTGFTLIQNKNGKLYTLLLIILFYCFSVSVFSQLSGTYTIGTGGDYTTFSSAATDLTTNGVSGPVIFNVLSGTYTGQFTLDYVPYADETNTITFQSLTGDSTDVVLKYDAEGNDDNFLITLKRCSYVTLKGITFWALDKTYNRIITMEDYGDHISFENCVFKGSYNTNAIARGAHIHAENALLDHLRVYNNRFSRGSFGIVCNSSGKNNLYPVIKFNKFDSLGYCAVFFNTSEAPEISKNMISYSTYGIYISKATNATNIKSNKLMNISHTGMQLNNLKSATGFESNIINNMVAVNQNGGTGIEFRGSDYLNIYNNSILVNRDYFESKAISLEYCVGSTIKMLNNNLVSLNNGYAIYVTNTGNFNQCDYNNFYTPGSIFAYWNNSGKCEDFRTFKSASGDNDHSVFAFPYYESETDLHTRSAWLDGAGTVITGIAEDIDGNTRNEPPDMGCYEFEASEDVKPPLGGTKTIGAGGDFPSLQEAIDAAKIKGISDSLKLQFLNGVHEGQCIITPIAGASSIHPVILESASGNPDDVQIRYQSNSTEDNFVIELKGSSFLHIQNLTLEATGPLYCKVFELRGMVDSLQVKSCVISGISQGDANNRARLVFSDYINFHHMVFSNNSFHNGSTSLLLNLTQPNSLPGELIISDNEFPGNGYQAIYLNKIESPVISDNRIYGSDFGISISHATEKLQINNNYIHTVYGSGIDLNSCSLPLDRHGFIYNNFIVCNGAYPNRSVMEFMNCGFIEIYYNSISSHSNSYKSRPLYVYSGQDLYFRNNIFSNKGLEYAFYIKNVNTATFSAFDYNNFYSEGTNLGYWDQDCADLDAIKSASRKNEHSVFANPAFAADTNLHVSSAYLDSAGTPISWILTDYDGDLRNEQYPDIGADEFTWMPENHPPVALNDTAEVYQGSGVDIEVLLNDSDPDNDSVYVLDTGTPGQGQITKIVDGVLTYLTPQSDFAGLDSVIYYISDERGMKDSAWVFIYVLKSFFDIGFEFYDPDGLPLTRGHLLAAHREGEGPRSDYVWTTIMSGGSGVVNDFPRGYVTASFAPDTVLYPELIKTYLGGTVFYREAAWFDLERDTSGVKIYTQRVHKTIGNSFITGTVINSSDSSALYNKWVFLIDNIGQIVKFDVTDNEGRFHFDSIPPGHYYFDGDFWYNPMDENNDSIFIEEEGQEYFVAATLINMKISVTVSHITGRRELTESEKFTLYPNPVTDKLYLKFDKATGENVKIRIFGIDGAMLKILQPGLVQEKGVLNIPVSDLPPGLYILSIEGNRINYKTRIVKQ